MRVRVRPAKPGDAGAIAKILSDWIDETPWMPRIHTRAEDRGFGAFLIEKTEALVATTRMGRIVGFLARRDGEIEALYISRRYRGRGVGSALLARARDGGGTLMLWTFQANAAAREFYRQVGFCEVELTDGAGNDEKLPDVRMVWKTVHEAQGADLDSREAA